MNSDDNVRIRAIIADDHPNFRRALSRLLRLDPDIEVVGEASDGFEARDLCLALRPDVALLDFMMPGLKGPEVVRSIKPSLPSTALLVLSVFGQDSFVEEAIGSGADGYLVKGTAGEELIAAVKEAAAKKTANTANSARHKSGFGATTSNGIGRPASDQLRNRLSARPCGVCSSLELGATAVEYAVAASAIAAVVAGAVVVLGEAVAGCFNSLVWP